MPSEPATVYVLQRRNWVRRGTGVEGHPNLPRLLRLPGAVRLASFDSEVNALAECARLEEQTRRAVNPFACDGTGLHYHSSFAEPIFRDWLLDADITPPEPGEKGIDWPGWWEGIKGTLDAVQWAHVWKALDRVVFHEVVARERKEVVYVIARIDWIYNDYSFDPRPDGSVPIKAYRSRKKAEDERLALEEDIRDDYDDLDRMEIQERLEREQPFRTGELVERPNFEDPSYPMHYEVIEVELEELTGSRR
jgi:hypothetical protein